MKNKYKNYISILKEKLDDYRFTHSLCVADRAVELAKKYGANEEKAYVAGLLHDITKNLSDEEQLQFFESSAIMLSDIEKVSSKVWHSISGAAYIKNKLLIDDEEIVSAVRYHTTGKRDMTLLQKIVYIADFTSADRKYPDVDVVRGLADKNLDESIVYALRHTIVTLANKNKPIHPDTISAYNDLLLKI
ncbi:MAG: bis(5'-nucleosyl)-tetraphosphatase (symmetrical) YqeK [Acutalibacteraceae bacterium]|nr:bis(5'-nucleosyl)-tetraphosphatase (symmetrical) YqeK [Acutalibacteraceae bacterium]